jgi:GNAT superfamily N-acetyltransferase
VTTLIKQYPLESGALEIQFIEEHFGEFGRRKTAADILARLADRPSLILMVEAPMPDDPGSLVPVAYKVVHELRADEHEPKLRDLVDRVREAVDFSTQRVVYSWIGGTRRDWRGQGHFRALSEEAEMWASALGCGVMLAKTKNRFHDMRAALAQLHFDVIKFEPNATDNTHSKIYYAKRLEAGLVRDPRASRTVVVMD